MTLTEFLLARIEEDKERAMAAITLVPWLHVANAAAANDQREAGLHVLEWQPRRVLAECEAKRRIVEAHPLTADVTPVHTGPTPDVGCETCHTVTASSIDDVDYVEALGPCDTLLALALPYADHPDYQPEWRP